MTVFIGRAFISSIHAINLSDGKFWVSDVSTLTHLPYVYFVNGKFFVPKIANMDVQLTKLEGTQGFLVEKLFTRTLIVKAIIIKKSCNI